jgi:DNA-binding GntR family transcriptional regulator
VTGSGIRDANLPLLKPRVLRQEVLDALRHAILTKEMAPGTRLLEAEVASQMGVSRAPVREAVRQLEQEGLVELVPHRGAVVLGLPDAEIDTIYEMRATIEARAMAAVSASLTPEQDAQILDLVEQMRDPLKRNDINAVSELDWQIHGLILELSQLTLLRRIWTSLYSLVQLRSYQALGRPGPAADYFKRTAIESHMALLEALRTGDAELASRAGRDHVLEVPTILAGNAR